jgi:diguanylate cyclase (GGDEF)-like protein
VWDEHRPGLLEKADVIERALAVLHTTPLEDPLRREAQRAAHMLSGSLGMFGFTRESEAAHELEQELARAAPAPAQTLSTLMAIVARGLDPTSPATRTTPATRATRASPESPASPVTRTTPGSPVTRASPATRAPGDPQPHGARQDRERFRMLVVDEDRGLCARIAAAAASRGIACETATSLADARALCAEHVPAIVLLDLGVRGHPVDDAYDLLAELSTAPARVSVLVLTDEGTFTDRVHAARRGSSAFLAKSLTPDELVSAVEQFRARARLAATRVLVVDDDPVVLDTMRVVLKGHDLEVATLADPLRFWETLEEVAPELLILDMDMPGVNGPDLCRTVRNDPRWGRLAVMFAAARADADTVELAFNAGADDYIAKPIVGPELLARVANRLERVRLYRVQAESDSLTGLSNRIASEEGLKRLAALSERSREPCSVVMLDVDRFKLVNDTHGHAVGDSVLRRMGACLRREFRGNDVVGRWGGEEFVVGMYGVTRENAVLRLTDVLERFGGEEFTGADGVFRVSFSAGVAEYPLDGGDPGAVCQAADVALYRAKAAGRARVFAVETGRC